jgi:hypothetical protein
VRAIELDPNYAPARVWYSLQLAMEERLASHSAKPHWSRSRPLAVISRFAVICVSYHAQPF